MSFLRQEYREDEDYDERPAAVIIYLILILALLVLWLMSVTRRGDDVVIEADPEPTVSSVVTTTPEPAVVVPREGGRLTVDDEPVFPLSEYAGPGGDLTRFAGGRAVADRVLVESVPANEGFWLGQDTTDRVWVQLVNVAPESPYKVEPGARVSFVGRVVPTPSDFPQDVGVTPAEGAEQMVDQRQHIQVEGTLLEIYD